MIHAGCRATLMGSRTPVRARISAPIRITHFLSLIPVEDVPREKVKLPKRSTKDKYDPEVGLAGRRLVPEVF